MGVSINGGTPIAGWFIMDNLFINGWFGGTPILGNLHVQNLTVSYFFYILSTCCFIQLVMFAEYPIGTTCGYNVFLQMWIIVKFHGLRSVSLFYPVNGHCLTCRFLTVEFQSKSTKPRLLYEYISPFYRSFYPSYSHTSQTIKILAYIYIHMIIIIMANYHMIFGPPYIWLYTWFSPGHRVQFRLPDTTKSQCLMVAPAGPPCYTMTKQVLYDAHVHRKVLPQSLESWHRNSGVELFYGYESLAFYSNEKEELWGHLDVRHLRVQCQIWVDVELYYH
jgi:hypothetical protein